MKIGAQGPMFDSSMASDLAREVKAAHGTACDNEQKRRDSKAVDGLGPGAAALESSSREVDPTRASLEGMVIDLLENRVDEERFLFEALGVLARESIPEELQDPGVVEKVCVALAEDPMVKLEFQEILERIAIDLASRK